MLVYNLKTSFLILIILVMLFNVGCANSSKAVAPISNRQSEEPVSPQQTVAQISNRQNDVDITEALQRALDDAFMRVSPDAVVAILHVAAPNRAVYDYLFGEIEHIVNRKGYNVSDRRELDQIRIEQAFQMSWEVDDNTAASIARFVGADAVITGRIDGEGSLQRLRIRVLNTETALVIGTGSEPFTSTILSTETPEDLPITQTMNITSTPSDASVLIYNQSGNVVFSGRTPANINLNTIVNTSYLVVISRDGYVNNEQTIRVINNRLERDRVVVSLERVPTPTVTQPSVPQVIPPVVQPPVVTVPPVTPPVVQTPATSSVRVGDIITFGRYEWRVLEVTGNRALIITKDIIERRAYHSRNENITWRKSSIRTYLNRELYNSFTNAERSRIVKTVVNNPNNSQYGTTGGSVTRDRIFLLSEAEARRYFNSNSDRIALLNDRVSFWWLRSPGSRSDNMCHVFHDGSILLFGNNVNYLGGVRPALWISL